MAVNNANSANRIAKYIRDVIDDYWKGILKEEDTRKKILEMMSDPEKRIKIRRGSDYTGVFLNIMGKKRLMEFERLTESEK